MRPEEEQPRPQPDRIDPSLSDNTVPDNLPEPTVPSLPDNILPPIIFPPFPPFRPVPPTSDFDPLHQQIEVLTQNEFDEDVLLVTFDDNSENNQWGFHEGSSSAHVTGYFFNYKGHDCYVCFSSS